MIIQYDLQQAWPFAKELVLSFTSTPCYEQFNIILITSSRGLVDWLAPVAVFFIEHVCIVDGTVHHAIDISGRSRVGKSFERSGAKQLVYLENGL